MGPFGELNAAWSLLERVAKWRSRRRTPDTSAARLVRLFAAHGIHRNQIPRILGHGLKLVDVHSDETLLSALTAPMLEDSADLFAVRRGWLECAEEQIYTLHDFYKNPEHFAAFLDELRARSSEITGVVLVARPEAHEETALIVLQEAVERGPSTLYRYHFCSNWVFTYWKSRAYLTACIAYAWRQDVYLLGREVPVEVIRGLSEGNRLLEHRGDSALPTAGRHWYPEDLCVKPVCFLGGLEEGVFGRVHGLDLWLQLDADGWMKTDLPYSDVRGAFVRARNSHASPETA